MLKRIQKIVNIGKFGDCRVPGCQFEKETIIFGLNTHGKSTFTAILRSLQTGNNDTLIGRKTFGATSGKGVEIDFEEAGVVDKHIFQSRAWNKSNPDILIFDSKFIAENVFDGENITFDQQKNLNTIIIGKRGQELNMEIAQLQKQSDDYTTQKTDKGREFNGHFPGRDFAKFKTIKEDTNIDETIKEKDKEIAFEKGKEDIRANVKVYLQSISGIRFTVRDIFIKTLDVKQEEIEVHIKSHFSKEEHAQTFLSEGLGFLKDKPVDGSQRSCTFCGQKMDKGAESLVELYSAYFKGGYKDLQDEIARETTYFKRLNIEAMLEKINIDLKAKNLSIGLDDAKISEISELKKEFEDELEKKRDLNYQIDFDSFDRLKEAVEQIATDLKLLQTTKLDISSPKTMVILENERKELAITKKRYESTWVTFCVDIATIDTEAERVRTIREERRKELDTYSAAIFGIHKSTINKLCKDMGADFEIEDFKPLKKIVGKAERIFAIQFFGTHKVLIDAEDEKSPNFKNTLSESDKRLLAFAFFISLLMHDKDLDKKIIVLDDPISSFDSERQRKTIHLISDIAYKYKYVSGTEKVLTPKQKIILTHEDHFAKELKRLMPSAYTLKIEEYVDAGQKRSRLAHADFDNDFPDDEISQRIDKIKGILDTRSFVTPFTEDCRIVLENIFKRKYYLELKNNILQKKSVRTFTTTLIQNKTNGFENTSKSNKFIRLCDDLNIELHDNSSANSNGNKESILNDFFECLKMI